MAAYDMRISDWSSDVCSSDLMEALAHGIFGETVVLGENIAVRRAHDAGDWRIIRETLPLHQQFERAIAPPPGRYFIAARLLSRGVAFGPDIEALEQGSPVDIVGERLDRHAGFRSEGHTSELPSPMRTS